MVDYVQSAAIQITPGSWAATPTLGTCWDPNAMCTDPDYLHRAAPAHWSTAGGFRTRGPIRAE